jgi:hypothetical protein
MVLPIIVIFCLVAIVSGFIWYNNIFRSEPDQPTPTYIPPEQLTLVTPRVPDLFDEGRIKSDLARLSDQPTAVAQYIAEAQVRFTQKRQIAVLAGWTEFYNAGKAVIAARTELARAHADLQQVHIEGEIKTKVKEVEIAKLDADKEEHKTRKVRTISARTQIQTPASEKSPQSEDDLKIAASQERDHKLIRYGVRHNAGKNLRTLKELHQWRKDERTIIDEDTLTSEERGEQYAQLEQTYAEFKRKLNIDVDIYEDDQ